MKNGGILGVTNGIQEAAKAIGWKVTVLDSAGSIDGRTAAFGQAMTLKPDGIIINGFDAVEQKPAMEAAKKAKIPMVSWHAARQSGLSMKWACSQTSPPMPWKSRKLRQTGPLWTLAASREW